MTVFQPLPDNTTVVEPKVKWGAIAAYVASAALLGIYNLATDNGNELLIAVLPDTIEWLILPLIPMAGSLIAGYAARHQWRQAEVVQNVPRQGGGLS